MTYVCDHLKLPVMKRYEMLKCIKISMSNGEEYTIKTNDLVAIQFVKDDKKILVRRGRIKDIVIINRRTLSTCNDNVSHIILDCSEQFSIKILEIKLKDIIKIGGIDDDFEDYSKRITELEPNYMEGNRIPVRQGGMITEEEMIKKVTKPEKSDVVKMNPETGEFNDLYDMNQNRPDINELKASYNTETDDEDVKSEDSSSTVCSSFNLNRGMPIMK